jgi:ATP-dependent DNA ligase
MLLDEIAHSVLAMSCVLDGEIVCRAPNGRAVFNRLLFRRDWPHFIAFDLLAIGILTNPLR